VIPSGLPGATGNREFFVLFERADVGTGPNANKEA
jgi:hypothetical protein